MAYMDLVAAPEIEVWCDVSALRCVSMNQHEVRNAESIHLRVEAPVFMP